MLRHASLLSRACVLLVFIAAAGHAQSINPDISVIPAFLLQSNDGEKLGEKRRVFSRPDLSFQEIVADELRAAGVQPRPLRPARA